MNLRYMKIIRNINIYTYLFINDNYYYLYILF